MITACNIIKNPAMAGLCGSTRDRTADPLLVRQML
jgi:hypothetical protein